MASEDASGSPSDAPKLNPWSTALLAVSDLAGGAGTHLRLGREGKLELIEAL